MAEDILDIAKWKFDYPFLKDVSDVYDKFNNNEYVDKNEGLYDALCDTIIKNVMGNVEKHKDNCKKLMRNLGYFSLDPKVYKLRSERCNILYNWIYNSINDKKITVDIINKCFIDYTELMRKRNNVNICDRATYDKFYEDPMSMTLLDIFDANMKTIENTLNGEKTEINIPCRKYVCKCVKIYKQMKDEYCLKGESGKEMYQNTCSRLENFKNTYKLFFQNNQDLKDKIPSLDDIQNTYMSKCQIYVQEKPEQPAVDEEQRNISPLTKSEDETSPETKSLIPPEDENQGGLMSPTVSTALSTVAGASSILALLYKFTPAKKWIHSGLGGSGGRIHSNFYANADSELLFDGIAHENLNSYNIGYEAVYDP